MPTPASKKIALPAEGVGSREWWKGQIDWSTDTKNAMLEGWRKNANAYRDKLTSPTPDGIRVNLEFEKTEQKKHQLFYRLPDFKLKPSPRTAREGVTPESPEADLKRVPAIFREALRFHIGPEGSNLKPTMDELIFDVLCPSGIAALKSGYERHTDGQIQVPTGAMIDDPNFKQPPGAVLGLAPVPKIPEVVPAPNVVAEEYYDSRISPAELLIPMDFRGSDYSGKAPFLGYWFPIMPEAAKAKGWAVPADSKGGSDVIDDSKNRIIELDQKGNRKGQLRACEIFYYAKQVDPTVAHPKRIRRIVFIDGVPDPVVHEDCKDQKWDERGRLIGGIDTLPIRVLTLRYVSDFPYPPSDCAVTRGISDAMAEFRTGQLRHRRKAVPRVALDVSRIADEKIKQKVIKGEHYDDIPIDGNPQNVAAQISQPTYPNDNWRTNDTLMDDANRAWALGANQSGVTEGGTTTATEIASINQATANRLGGEREKVVGEFFIGLVRHKAQLLQLYADQEDYVEIVGPQGAKTIEAWNKDTIAGKYIFEAIPDSSMPPDAQADRDLALNRYNLLANDPFANRQQLYRDTVEAYGGDPDRLTKVPDQEGPKQPEARVNLSLKGEDLDPAAPQYANVVNLMQVLGVPAELSPATPGAAEPEDEATGPADVVDRERLRMAESDETDARAGGLVGV